jgi:hypothetical protein
MSFYGSMFSQAVSFNVAGTNPRCYSSFPTGVTYSGSAIAPTNAVQIVDVKFQRKYQTGGSSANNGASFTVTPGTTVVSVNYSNSTTGAGLLTLSPVNTIFMEATIRFRTVLGGSITTVIVNSPTTSFNYFGAPTVDCNINSQFAPPSPTAINAFFCAGDVLMNPLVSASGTGVQWRMLLFQSSASGNEGTPSDVNLCGWKTGSPPSVLNVTTPESMTIYQGCAIRPQVKVNDSWLLVKLEVTNDCGTTTKSVLLHMFSQPTGATVDFFFRGSVQVDAKLPSGPNTSTGTGEKYNGGVSPSDGILSFGGTQAAPTLVGASQTVLDCSSTNFLGGVLSWNIVIRNITGGNAIVGSTTINTPNNTQINISQVPISLNGGMPNPGYFASNFNTSSTGVLGKTFSIELTGNGVCNQINTKTGFFTIASDFSWWKVDDGILDEVSETANSDSNEELQISPNPSDGIVTINIESINDDIAQMHIVGLNGQIVKSDTNTFELVKGFNSFSQDISNLPVGTYMVQIVKSNATLTKRLIKL